GAVHGFDEARSFYFRGPDHALNLRAQTLPLFLQIAHGVDDATFLHHLRAGDYSGWFRDTVRDAALADATARIEESGADDVAQSRLALDEAVREHLGRASAG